jgi:cell division protein FtsB
MRSTKAGALRFFSRLIFGLVIIVVFTLISIQFSRIVHENVAMAHTLASVQRDVRTLRDQREHEERQLQRLLNPQGAVPEIHDRLHLVAPNEAIIYIKPAQPAHK